MAKRTVVGTRHGSFARMMSPSEKDMYGLSEVTPESIVAETKAAFGLLRCGHLALLEGCLSEALDYFFKSAVISVNLIFTARVHKLDLPESFLRKASNIASHAIHGIKKVMKILSMKKILKHEELLHPLSGQIFSGRLLSC